MNETQIKPITEETKKESKEENEKITRLPEWSIEPPLEIKKDEK